MRPFTALKMDWASESETEVVALASVVPFLIASERPLSAAIKAAASLIPLKALTVLVKLWVSELMVSMSERTVAASRASIAALPVAASAKMTEEDFILNKRMSVAERRWVLKC